MRLVPAFLVLTVLPMLVPCTLRAASVTDRAVAAMEKGDYKAALDELRPLAARGDRDAQFLMGMLYDAGKGVAKDQTAAASWYRKAASQDHVMAQVYLGVLTYSGQGVQQNPSEAARWFRAAAEGGNDQAQFYLGSMYQHGAGVPVDTTEAIRWLGKSAAQRNTRAMGLVATLLFGRSRDSQDRAEAYAWSHLAAEMDAVQASTTARVVIAKYCTNEQKKQGKALMADWKRKWSGAAKAKSPAR